MEEKYGKVFARIKTTPGYSLPLLYPVLGFSAIGGLVIPSTPLDNKNLITAIFLGLAAALLIFVLMQIFYCRVILYDNAVHVRTILSRKTFSRDEITAIIWSRPGAYEGSTRGAKRNNEVADLILKNGKDYKLSSGVYKKIGVLGEWQSVRGIPLEL